MSGSPEKIATAFGLKSSAPGTYKARCQAHDDRSPSLSVTITPNKALVICHAGCSTDAICQAVDLPVKDLFFDEKAAPRREVARYDYGNYAKVRYEPKDFRFFDKNGNPGLNGHEHVLYHLTDVETAKAGGHAVFLTEGEKDCDTIREKLQCVAVSLDCGAVPANASPARLKPLDALKDLTVYILLDQDAPGKIHGGECAKYLQGKAKELYIVNVQKGKDVTEYFEQGGTPEEFREICAAAPVYQPGTLAAVENPVNFFKNLVWSCSRFSDDPPEIPAIIEGMLLRRIVAMLYAAGGVGKSTLFLFMAVRIALANIHKVSIFGHEVNGCTVALISGEDPDLILNKILIGTIIDVASEYELEYDLVRNCVNEHLLIGSTFGKCVQLFELDDRKGTLQKTEYFTGLIDFLSSIRNLHLIGIDTKARFSPGEGAGNNVATQEIQHYEELVTKTGSTAMLLHHTNKASRNGMMSGQQSFRDVSALFDSVRACWYLRSLTDDELKKENISADDSRRYTLFENTKNNYLPIVPTVLLERTGYNFKARSVSPKLTKSDAMEKRLNDDVSALLAIMQPEKELQCSKRKIIELCNGKIPKGRVCIALDMAINLEYVTVKRAEKNGRGDKYSLTEEGKKYETVPSF